MHLTCESNYQTPLGRVRNCDHGAPAVAVSELRNPPSQFGGVELKGLADASALAEKTTSSNLSHSGEVNVWKFDSE